MDREQRIIENEKLFREVNERVAQIQANYSGPDPEWVCECGDETCFEKVALAVEDYEQIRTHSDWFVIRPGHDKPDVERVVHQYDGYVVVEKFAAV
jgi:23S rRNA A1618 N6-methylase RlmF